MATYYCAVADFLLANVYLDRILNLDIEVWWCGRLRWPIWNVAQSSPPL